MIATAYSRTRLRMLVGVDDIVISEFARHESSILAATREGIQNLAKKGHVAAEDAAEMLADVSRTESQLASQARRAASSRPVSALAKAAARSAQLQHVTTSRLAGLMRKVGEAVDPQMFAEITRLLERGPHGANAWNRIGGAVERLLFIESRTGQYNLKAVKSSIIQHLGELLAASHPQYRRLIEETSNEVRQLGLIPKELQGSSRLLPGNKEFRDGGLLAISRIAESGKPGRAGLVVTLESRQARTQLEAGLKEEAALARTRGAREAALPSAKQQVSAVSREEEALIEEGGMLLTPDGELYELAPVPPALRTHVLARPHLLPKEETLWLGSAAQTQLPASVHAEYEQALVQIATPYSSDQLGRFAGQILDRLFDELSAVL